MEHFLNAAEVRVLGTLIEKEITTPANYPLSLNALQAACNQTSNRFPVVQFDEATVSSAADSLREKGLVHLVDRGESRITKYRHVVYEAMNLRKPAVAVLCVLMLRGPQTVGEIRTRSNRMHDFASLEDVETTLNALMSGDDPWVVRLNRMPGQKEVRYAHRLSAEVADVEPEELDRIAKLEKEIEDLKAQFEQFRRQFE